MISRKPLANFQKRFDVAGVFIRHGGHILLLHRQDHKPQGNKWGVVAGKVDSGEDALCAIVREVREEIGLVLPESHYLHHDTYYVRHDGYDFMYHLYHLPLDTESAIESMAAIGQNDGSEQNTKDITARRINKKPEVRINPAEHKAYRWLAPAEALSLDLVPDEDMCIKWFFEIE